MPSIPYGVRKPTRLSWGPRPETKPKTRMEQLNREWLEVRSGCLADIPGFVDHWYHEECGSRRGPGSRCASACCSISSRTPPTRRYRAPRNHSRHCHLTDQNAPIPMTVTTTPANNHLVLQETPMILVGFTPPRDHAALEWTASTATMAPPADARPPTTRLVVFVDSP